MATCLHYCVWQRLTEFLSGGSTPNCHYALNCDKRHYFCIIHSTKYLLWFGGHHVAIFVHTLKDDISKLGVSSSFHTSFYHFLDIGYLENNKEKVTCLALNEILQRMNPDDSDLSSLSDEDDYQSDNGSEMDGDNEDHDVTFDFSGPTQWGIYTDKFNPGSIYFQENELPTQEMDSRIPSTYDRLYQREFMARVQTFWPKINKMSPSQNA
ncbi:hypothetical protein TNIN_214451 [Trichonephila inaurata madagascariensis]|uniref:Uncharacterized protein n=1 Tax=Trichonephila inaurata madagascariensis TaxID=2747483 RepID=A0A8X6YRQ8_9ARAC|nr:hypothetical protein TNIN_214451 [Trichonephila inaurata madagascariensis]